MDGMLLAAPSVLHAETDHHPTPDTVYVCGGSDASSLTPWACPLDPERFSVTDAMQIIHCRADAGDWLARLSGKTLTCIRCCNNDRCWAVCQKHAFVEFFGEDSNDDTYQYDFDDVDDYLREEVGYDTFVQDRDEIGLNDIDDGCIPRHVPWMSSWCNLVD